MVTIPPLSIQHDCIIPPNITSCIQSPSLSAKRTPLLSPTPLSPNHLTQYSSSANRSSFCTPKILRQHVSINATTSPLWCSVAHILLQKQTIHHIGLLSTVCNQKIKQSVQYNIYSTQKTKEPNPNNSISYTTAASRSHVIQRCRVSHKPGLVGDRASSKSWTNWSPPWVTFTLHTQIITPASKMGPAQTLFTFMREVPASNLGQDRLA